MPAPARMLLQPWWGGVEVIRNGERETCPRILNHTSTVYRDCKTQPSVHGAGYLWQNPNSASGLEISFSRKMASQGAGDQQKKPGPFSGAFKNLGFTSRLTGAANPGGLSVRTTNRSGPQLEPQDSIPEIVSSPTDVGIYDGGHQGEKMTW